VVGKPFARFEIGYMDHPKFMALSGNAISLWHEAKDYCAKYHTDGLIPADAVKHFRFAGKKSIALLTTPISLPKPDGTAYGPLWEVHPVGFKMHDYLEHNDCREDILARMEDASDAEKLRKAKNKARQAKYRAERKAQLAELERRGTDNGPPPGLLDRRHATVTPDDCDVTRDSTRDVTRTCSTPTETATTTVQRKDQKDSSEVNSEPPPVMEFPVVGDPKQQTWGLSQSRIDAWREAYPGIDIVQECHKARAWAIANPSKRKTARGMPSFLVRWLGNAVDRGRATPAKPHPAIATAVSPALQRRRDA